MKSLTLFSILATIPSLLQSGILGEEIFTREVKKEVVLEKVKVEPIETLVSALVYVESRGNSNAVGDTHLDEPSIGVLQLRPIMVREVNRILKLKGADYRYDLSDRKDSAKSVEMFMIWKEFHHKDSDFEKIARNWNGGPNGYKNSRTAIYWNKVQDKINENRKTSNL